MSKNPPQQESEIKHISDLFKKFKRFEPYIGVGFFFFTVCVIFCFFYLDSQAVTIGFRVPSKSSGLRWLGLDGGGGSGGDGGSIESRSRVEFLSEKGNECNLFDGDWVWDDNYPLYHSKACSFLDDGFRCIENGRPDLFYTKWRWQPRHCNLPRCVLCILILNFQNGDFDLHISSSLLFRLPNELIFLFFIFKILNQFYCCCVHGLTI